MKVYEVTTLIMLSIGVLALTFTSCHSPKSSKSDKSLTEEATSTLSITTTHKAFALSRTQSDTLLNEDSLLAKKGVFSDEVKEQAGPSRQLDFRSSYDHKAFANGATVRNNQQRIASEGNSYDLMEFSRGLGALIAMYETTDSVRYLEDAIKLSEDIIKKTRKGLEIPNNPRLFKDEYRGWLNSNPKYENNKRAGRHLEEVPLFESYLFRYLSKIVYLAKASAYADKSFNRRVADIFDFLLTNGWEKWYVRGERSAPGCFPYLFRSRTHMTSHWAITALYLRELDDDLERTSQYNWLLTTYDQQLRGNLQLTEDDAYKWNMTWDNPWPLSTECNQDLEEPIIQDVSHGSQVVNYVIEAYEMGAGTWTLNDIQAFSNTLKYIIYDPENHRFNGDLSGNFIAKVADGRQMADGFIKLARYDKEVFQLFEDVRVRQEGNYKFSLYEPQYVAEMYRAENLLNKR